MPVRPPEVRRIDFSSGYQYYTFWSPATAQRSRGHIDVARCSWCLAATKHLLVESHKLRRNVYECGTCARRTVPCRGKGCGALAKGGLWDAERCVVCTKEMSRWPLSAVEIAEQRAATEAQVASQRILLEEARARAEAELRKRPAMLRTGMSPADFRYSDAANSGYASSTASSEDGDASDNSSSSSESEEDDPVSGGRRSNGVSDDQGALLPRVQVTFSGEGRLGLSFARDSTPAFTIAKVAPLTLAAHEPRLRVGMALVAVQGEEIAGLRYDAVLGKLKGASRPLTLAFVHTWLSG
jgi:hypothetical protein